METVAFEHDGPAMECRRFPPQIIFPRKDDVAVAFPTVYDTDWCGEYVASDWVPAEGDE
jgi:hypothetical protein